MRGKAVGVLVFAVLLASSSAHAYLNEHFESYANQTAYNTAWPSWATDNSHMALVQGFGYNSNQSTSGYAAANNAMWCYQNLDNLDPTTGYSGKNGVTLDFMLYDQNTTLPASPNPGRNFISLRAYNEADGSEGMIPKYNSTNKALQGLVSLGLYESATAQYGGGAGGRGHYAYRIYYGGVSSWYATKALRTVGWHKMRMVVLASQVQVYVDDMNTPDAVVPLTNKAALYAFDGVIIGSGLTSANYDVAFDELAVTPEPTALVLLGLGSLLLLRRR